jgi:HNH endonuclease
MTRCIIDGCERRMYSRKIDAHGLCRKHHMDAAGAKCAIQGCCRNVHSYKADPRGLCITHHNYLRRFGVAEASMEQRLAALTDKSAGPNGCWIWLGGCGVPGYGRFNNRSPHRLAYEYEYGKIPAGLVIDHICHTGLCINPKHLRAATQKQNNENRKGGHGRSGIRGVQLQPNGRWRACVVHNRKYIHVGLFATADQADEAARAKRLELFTHNDVDRRRSSVST